MDYRTLNPATEELVETYPYASEAELRTALDRATRAFASWRTSSHGTRRDLLLVLAERLEGTARAAAELMALEMGKPLAEGEAEAKKCAWVCRYYAENGEAFTRPRAVDSDAATARVRFDPLGPILAIMPWNFPYWQFFRFAAPALAAGNVVLLKHAPGTPRVAIELERLLLACGAPEGLCQNLRLDDAQAARVIAAPEVRGVTLTGSTRAGREVGAVAGRQLKPMVLELGGSDPFVVFADADVGEAARVGAASRCLNSGQSCIAAKRFLVERPALEDFTRAFVAALEGLPVGDPRAAATRIGPLARQDLGDGLRAQVASALAAGAVERFRGNVPAGAGFYHPATVLTGIDPRGPAALEEMFGPVAQLFPFDAEDDAVDIANATPYGLGAALFTRDPARVDRLVPRIDAGAIFVNGMVKSDPRLPFGGIKDSGFGRELAAEGLHEFVNVKTVWIR